ncbi:MAG: hypothetical protein RL141_726 [Candidatus Parcubacteria bacterium]|jgi:hypothetical protein
MNPLLSSSLLRYAFFMESLFDGVVGHVAAKRVLEQALVRPQHAYLIVGERGLGAHALAERFVRALAGMPHDKSLLSHPDVAVLSRESGEEGEGAKSMIPVKAVRALRERLQQRPVVAPRMVAYLPEADRLNEEGVNALLKQMEEAPAGAVFVLVARDASRLPDTVRSRTATLALTPVPDTAIAAWLATQPFPEPERQEAVRQAAGRPGYALRWLQDVEVRRRAAEATRTVEVLLAATSAGEAIAAIDTDARRADAADDPQEAWEEWLSLLMHALRQRFGEAPSLAATALGRALIAARTRVGGSVAPRIWLELELTRGRSG